MKKVIGTPGKMWIKIVIFILMLIANGLSREKAVEKAAVKFGVSVSDIWKRGRF